MTKCNITPMSLQLLARKGDICGRVVFDNWDAGKLETLGSKAFSWKSVADLGISLSAAPDNPSIAVAMSHALHVAWQFEINVR